MKIDLVAIANQGIRAWPWLKHATITWVWANNRPMKNIELESQ